MKKTIIAYFMMAAFAAGFAIGFSRRAPGKPGKLTGTLYLQEWHDGGQVEITLDGTTNRYRIVTASGEPRK